MLNSSFKNRFI